MFFDEGFNEGSNFPLCKKKNLYFLLGREGFLLFILECIKYNKNIFF